ncbi:hypothetical protein P5673_021378, partial [Acropora cervicornis]
MTEHVKAEDLMALKSYGKPNSSAAYSILFFFPSHFTPHDGASRLLPKMPLPSMLLAKIRSQSSKERRAEAHPLKTEQ